MKEQPFKEICRVSSFKARKRGIKEGTRTIRDRSSPRKHLSTFLVPVLFVLCGGPFICALASAQGIPTVSAVPSPARPPYSVYSVRHIAALVVAAAPEAVGELAWLFRLTGKAPAPAVQARIHPDRPETELVLALPQGFQPGEITRPQGKFFLDVENHTGLAALTLRLDRAAGNRLHEVRVPREQRDWAELLDLPPGEYVLTAAEQPAWKCRITVTAR